MFFMKFILLAIILSLLVIRCNNNSFDDYVNTVGYSEYVILENNDTLGIRFPYEFLLVVPVKNKNTEYEVVISNDFLYHFVYKQYYSKDYNNFIDFLREVLSNRLWIKEEFIKGYKINTNNIILREYQDKGFDFIKAKYVKNKGDKLYALSPMDIDNYFSLIKIMFEHNYYIIEDDYSGQYRFYKKFKY